MVPFRQVSFFVPAWRRTETLAVGKNSVHKCSVD